MKRFALPLMLALTMSVSAVPAADAGPFRDKIRDVAKKIIVKGGCIGDRILGQRNSILCN